VQEHECPNFAECSDNVCDLFTLQEHSNLAKFSVVPTFVNAVESMYAMPAKEIIFTSFVSYY
jgi:hypothetical protein